ncbi:hypothetical protein ACJIZ3_000059 [Penstemon smallii]|uniref:Ribosomal protein L2 n=1 Tax=Penstemon smallii TaxID=265156 RepID=A0ABD3RAU1_9LAMI
MTLRIRSFPSNQERFPHLKHYSVQEKKFHLGRDPSKKGNGSGYNRRTRKWPIKWLHTSVSKESGIFYSYDHTHRKDETKRSSSQEV